MRALVVRRILIALPLLWGLLTINFFLVRLVPGDPGHLLLDPDTSEEARENLRRAWGLDRPLIVQYGLYLERVCLHFDLGRSIRLNRPVLDVVADALPDTLALSAAALLIQITLGASIGILAAIRQGGVFDNVSRLASLVLYSVPSFYLGLLLIALLAGDVPGWDILPSAGARDIVRHDAMGSWERLIDELRHLVLPALTLGLGSAAGVSRYVRGEMLDVLRQEWILAARARGLSERVVILRHALRSALLPLITIVGLSLPFLFGGAVIVEEVFARPGMGRVAVAAAKARDYPVIVGVNLGFAAVVVASSLIADLLYMIADPRVRLGRRTP